MRPSSTRLTTAAFIVLLVLGVVCGCSSLGFLVVGEWMYSAISGWLAVAMFVLTVVAEGVDERVRKAAKQQRGERKESSLAA